MKVKCEKCNGKGGGPCKQTGCADLYDPDCAVCGGAGFIDMGAVNENAKQALAAILSMNEKLEKVRTLLATEQELREAVDIQENEYTREWFRGWKALADEIRKVI